MPKNITLTDPIENSIEDCDAALGGYMRAWDQMLILVIEAVRALLNTHLKAAYILIHSGIDQPTLRTILESAGRLRLGETDQKKLDRLLRRWKDASSKRNRIVHGIWQLSVEITEEHNEQGIKRTKARWIRYYPPADMNKIDPLAMRRNQKLRAAHLFDLAEIDDATQHVRRLASDFNEFLKSARLKAFVDASPVEFDQYGTGTPQSTETALHRHPRHSAPKGAKPPPRSSRG